MDTPRRKFFSIFLLGGFLLAIFYWRWISHGALGATSKKPVGDLVSQEARDAGQLQGAVQVGSSTIRVELATTTLARETGLSGRAGLLPGTGMLFVFDTEDRWGFWMPDMQFAIDIVWIDRTGRVVGLEEHVSPASYPKVFRPAGSALYVLEVEEGRAASLGFQLGVQARVDLP